MTFVCISLSLGFGSTLGDVSNPCKDSIFGNCLVKGKGINTVLCWIYPSFYTINDSDGNISPTRYWQAMCGFIKGNKSVFVHSEQHNPSTAFISLPYQGLTNRNVSRNHRNRHQQQFSNMIPRKQQCINHHWGSNLKHRIQFPTIKQRLSSRGKYPYPTWDRYFQYIKKNMFLLLPFWDISQKCKQENIKELECM